jgi:hypothetical protein
MSSSIHLNASNPAKRIESHISGGPFDLGLNFQRASLIAQTWNLAPPRFGLTSTGSGPISDPVSGRSEMMLRLSLAYLVPNQECDMLNDQFVEEHNRD